MRLGRLNLLVSGPVLHRWHPSRHVHKSNNNYWNNLAVWDLVFGSYFLPPDATVKQLGVLNRRYPSRFWAQLWAPFVGGMEGELRLLPSTGMVFVNLHFHLRMMLIGRAAYLPFVEATRDPERIQEIVLLRIVRRAEILNLSTSMRFRKLLALRIFKIRFR